MVMQMSSVIPSAVTDLSVPVMLASAVVLIAAQLPPVSRRRVMAALVVALVGGTVLAAADLIGLDPCTYLEPGSILWYANWCFWN